MSRNQRLALLGLAVVVVVVAFIIARPSSDDGGSDTTATSTVVVQKTVVEKSDGQTSTVTRTVEQAPAVPVVVVKDGEAVGGIKKLSFARGGTIDFKVRATAPGGEVHFHGYDVHETVPAAGGTVEFRLKAKISGIFVVEMEASGQQIAQVEVGA